MNWLDIVILIVLAVSALFGMKTGLIGAVISAVGIFIGWLLAGQFAGDLGGWLSNTISSDTVVTVVAYAIIIFLALIISGIIAKIVRPILTIATLGLSSLVDKVGGLAGGIILGGLLSGALILGLTRLTYDFEVPEVVEGAVGEVTSRLPPVDDIKETLETGLAESTFVPIFVDVASAIPGDTIGFVPDDFKVSLEMLEKKIDSSE